METSSLLTIPKFLSVSYRKTNQIDTPLLQEDLLSLLPPIENTSSSPDDILNSISQTLALTLDSHASLTTRSVRHRPQSKWFNDELRAKKRFRRSCERKLQSAVRQNHPNIQEFRNNLKAATNSYFDAIELTRQNYSKNLIENSSNKASTLFKVADKLLSSHSTTSEPPISSDNLAEYFIDKIKNIRSSITAASSNNLNPPYTPTL